MILGIDCSRYAADQPTGVEIYTDRIVEGLLGRVNELSFGKIRLYVKTAAQMERLLDLVEKTGQKVIEVKLIEREKLWTVLGLSWEMFRSPVDALFVPSHVLPFFVPKKTFFTVHGLEAFLFPRAYTWFQRWYQRFSLGYAKRKGTRFIAVSKAVKGDLMRFMGIENERISVVYNGFDPKIPSSKLQIPNLDIEGPYILNIGRLETRKNQFRLVEAFDILAEEFPKLNLVLVGPDGEGAERVRRQVDNSPYKDRIVLAGYQAHGEVQALLRRAQIFAYPSLAEGFGIPILEAFDAGVPVLTSEGSATEEVGGDAAVYCHPEVYKPLIFPKPS